MAVPMSATRLQSTIPSRYGVTPNRTRLAPPLLTVNRPSPRLVTARRRPIIPATPLRPRTGLRPSEDKGWLGGLRASIGNVPAFLGQTIKALPTIAGKTAQSAVGFGETLFDIGADIINPNLYTSRSEVDLAKGRALGLTGPELLAYSMQRTVPILAPVVESIPKTAGRVAESATAGLGTRLLTGRNFVDFGEPGFDYTTALRRGQLGSMLIEDIGNIMIGGRVLGLGNLGVQAGRRVAAAGRPGLGRAISTVGRFAEEPIGTSARGVAGLASRAPGIATAMGRTPGARLTGLGTVASQIAQSERPLLETVRATGAGFRGLAERNFKAFDKQRGEALLQSREAREAGRAAEAADAALRARDAEKKRDFWFRLGQTQLRARQQVRANQIPNESVMNTFNQTALRFAQRGSVPESPRSLRNRATSLRTQAERVGDPARAQALTNQADLLDRQATVKESDTQGKLENRENRNINFSAAVIVTSKLIDQIMADRRAGKSIDEIMATIRPREILPNVEEAGYAYTPQAVQRAIDFVEGRLDEVDRLDMDTASQQMASAAGYLQQLVLQPGTLVTGVLSPAQFGDTPIPEIVLAELKGRRIANAVLGFLDNLTPQVIVTLFDQLVEPLADALESPDGLFSRLARSRPDSPEYAAAMTVLAQAAELLSDPKRSPISNDPRVRQEVAEFFADPAIYPARLRPMMAYREARAQEARAADVNNALFGLRSVLMETPGLVRAGRVTRLNSLLDEFADPRRQFDRDFYMGVRDLLNDVVKDLRKRREATATRKGAVDVRVRESDILLEQIEAQARAVAGMVEQALLRPEEIQPMVPPEVGKLRSEAQALTEQADETARQPDELTNVRKQIETGTEELTKVRREKDEADAKVREAEQALEPEERILGQAVNDAQQMTVFLAELDAATMLRQQGVDAPPTPAEQKAWKEERLRVLSEEMDFWESQFSELNAGNVIRPQRQGKEIQTATGGVQEVNVRRVGGIGINRMFLEIEDYADYFKRGIPNPTHRRAFVRDHTVKGDRINPATGVRQPTKGLSIDIAARGLPEDVYLERMTEAYSRYMETLDEYNRISKLPFKGKYGEQVKDEMMASREASLEEQAFANPETGETIYGVRSLETLRRIEQMLTDTEAFAAQVDKVNALRNDVARARSRSQAFAQRAADMNASISSLVERARQLEPTSSAFRAGVLRSQATELADEAQTLETEAARLRSPQERLMVTRESGRRMRVATPVRSDSGEVTGYTFTKGVAKKLDDAQTKELRQNQRLYEQQQELQAKLNEEDAALTGAVDVARTAQQYPGALAAPTGRALLAAAEQRPRLLGETAQPTWIPVGEAANIRPRASMEVEIRGEGMAPESKISIERQRTSTFMAQTPEQFAARIKEILRQVTRNRVAAAIIGDETLTSDVQTTLGDARNAELLDQATREVTDQGINRGTQEFESKVRQRYGDLVIEELDIMGFEPVSPVVMPEAGDIYAERAAIGDLMQQVRGENINPTTLVMRRGLRGSLSAYFEPAGGSRLPPKVDAALRFVSENTARWKSVVLPLSLRWQVGDAMGNVINAYIRGGIPPAELARRITEVSKRLREPEGLNRRQMMFGDVFGENLADPVLQTLVGAGLQQFGIRLSDLKEMHPRGTLKPPPDVRGVSRVFLPRIREKSFAFNETQNGMVRSAVAISKLEESLMARGRNIDEIDPVSIHNDPVLYEAVREAVDEANDVLGNFSQLSPWEKSFVRQVYPFWSWVKFINKAAAQLLISQPDRVLFYAHLGSLATGDDGEFLYDWLRNLTPVPIPGMGTTLIDLSFTNPYSDAILMGRSPFEELSETATNVSPIIRAGLRTAGELTFGVSGRRFPLFEYVSRPGYLEGRPEATSRTMGDVLGGIAYQNFRTFAGPYRFLTDVMPTGRIPGTDVMLGPGPRYPQGSARTTGLYSRPLLSPTQERIGALLQGFGVPVPAAQLSQAQAQGRQLARLNRQALLRRARERRLSRVGSSSSAYGGVLGRILD